MAAFGAKFINFSPIAKEEEGNLPEYGGPVEIGALVKAELTVNLASGEIYGNNLLDERMEEFVSGTLAVEVTDMTDEIEAGVYGSTLTETEKELVDNTGDEVPYGGLAYYKTLSRKGKKVYRAYYYPKTKAILGNDAANTKGSSITLSPTALNFTIFEPDTGDWRYRKTFDSEKDARDYVIEKLSKKAVGV